MKCENTTTDHNRTLRFTGIDHEHLSEMLVIINYPRDSKPVIDHAVVLDGLIVPAIIRAVNSHDDLLAACEWAAKSEHHPKCKCHGEYSAFPQYCTCHVGDARDAIAKAEGETQ